MKILMIGTTVQSLLGFRYELLKDLVSAGHEVYALSVDYDHKSKQTLIDIGVVPIDYTISRSGINPFKDFVNFIFLYKLIKKITPDIVFSYFTKPCIWGSLAAYYAGVHKIIAMLEGLGFLFTEQPSGIPQTTKILKRIQILLYRIAFKKINTLIVLNEDDKNDLLNAGCIEDRKVYVLGGIGINLEHYKYSPAPLEPISFIFIGRLLREKGIYEFIAAAKNIKERFEGVTFNVLGNIDPANPGSLKKNELDTIIKEEIINYVGYVNDVSHWLSKSSVFVLPSYREGFPRSTQEAMAIGRAVITTDVPGCRDTVVNNSNGFLIQRWSSDALAEAMEKFILSKELIRDCGKESARIAKEKFDTRITNKKIITILLS
ncbi:TPA: glycosyltransferase family 4 protein [Salmonella enterica subsp. enterica serovar Concord]|uniref:Glycosyltransferase n=6 Tax=Salmonella enterica TaxID=28901 RepID=U3GK79_SALER|nr:glycosyltransferase [Salmonella enterica]AXD04158.1 glycosyltransferase family 1 protein [Salmonella enterica subsp. enterica serovar Milwaukee str. SA19950795]AZT07410.1 glycosyltransferase family 1 protein [Salmonella enterica subsp. enterica serovar 43:a:1,7]EAA2979999.1 glycosyltransferase family 1 protein [Salmonella enterica subsp. enterica serovar Mbao]EAB7348264.1 glycosyltransferase family 1 protein [Salmonella enterica subsp. enterica serovar Epalinges]EAW1728177.1 glycosyltransfe